MTRTTTLHQANACLGEGPIWDGRSGALYWVDIRRRFIHRFDVSAARQTGIWVTPRPPGCIALTSDASRLLVAAGDEISVLDLRTGREESVARLPIERPLMRANDGRVDGAGRLWVGTMIDDIHAPDRFRDGRLFCVHPNGQVEDSGVAAELPNGIGWSPDGRTMYLNDSTAYRTRSFDFDPETGRLSNERVFFEHPAQEGLPDGLCVDGSGDVWSGQWNGWNIKRIGADGELRETIRTPAQRPSSVTFFGEKLDRLAYTSAANGFETADFLAAPDAGSLFELSVSAAGRPEHPFKV